VYAHLLSLPGVAYDDLDEARNRVTIGISDRVPGLREDLITRLRAMNVPIHAVHFEVAEPASFTSTTLGKSKRMMDPGGTITGYTSSIGGGYRIYPSGCTATVTGRYAGQAVLATVSHCTNAQYQVDGGPLNSYYGATIGTETYDPSPTSSYCTFGFNCLPARGSDAALFVLNGVQPSVPGGIAHLTSRWSSLPPSPDLTVDPDRPWLYVTGTASWVTAGETVEKVGVTTGWTYGTITNSCIDVRMDGGYSVRCANKVSAWVATGDSGGPIFMLDDASDPTDIAVTLVGTEFGSSGSTTPYHGESAASTMLFSSFASFIQELGSSTSGNLDVSTDHKLGALSLSAALEGGAAHLSWNDVGTAGFTTATQYRIYAWDSYEMTDQAGDPYEFSTVAYLVDSTAGTSYVPSPTWYSSTDCDWTTGNVVTHYYVVAWNQGIKSTSDYYCFQ
jgi:hypothetical protein